METRSLLYFIAVAEEKNVGRAATRLHVTQPALSRQIQLLERELGVPLFVRSATGMEITSSGTALLHHARAISVELAHAKATVPKPESDPRQQLDIGVYGSAIFAIIPRILSLFSQRYPNVEFCLHNVRKDQQVELLRQGKTRIAFDRYLPEQPDLVCELVYHEYLNVALYKDHPLTSRETIDLDELRDEPRIGGNLDSAFAASLAQAFGLKPHTHRADDLFTTLMLVGCGFGISFAPPSIQALQIPNVVFRPLSGGPRFPFDLQCMYRKNDESPLLRDFLETVRDFRASQTTAGQE
jgi:DNA-binding transcriptional LysR family regulator